jgi:maltose O-acetyltransferase
MTEKDKMLAGQLFLPGDPELERDRRTAEDLLLKLNAIPSYERAAREGILQLLLGASHEALVNSPFNCTYGFNIHLGSCVLINTGCVILDECSVTIGSQTFIGPGVHIYTAGHPIHPSDRARPDGVFGKPVSIGERVWIGGGTRINPNLTIGHAAIIGAGAVVTKNIPDMEIWGGNPARLIRKVTEADLLHPESAGA